VGHARFKEFWKNNHFENMRADFLRRSQNFGKLALKGCIFRHEKNVLIDIML
jgi:hypothetical protein